RCQGYLLGAAVLLGSFASEPTVLEKAELAAGELAPVATSDAESPALSGAAAEVKESVPRTAGETLFACQTAQDKVIEVYDMGASIQYAFGPKEQLELVLDVPREQASTYQWQGIGRYENYSVSIPNGETIYTVFWGRDRLDINAAPEAGVSVEIDGEYIATVDCATEAVHNLIGVDLPATLL
ncbi:MAG: hypothetical protein AAF959_17865, partial [Cyanobacteria bacterium P01_D01_bin.56]